MAEPIQMHFGILSQVCPGNHIRWGILWLHLANMIEIEPSVCVGSASLYQITLTCVNDA